ncbi:hypothetical protein [Antarctobacter heliothermus]|uniref:hypothetical protein n=1 Tax=Antarctobacter heliothermus TaxID=74033 RepID=UPI000B776F96|nr:hypothetical protein [Antarctobacter heliothermus]
MPPQIVGNDEDIPTQNTEIINPQLAVEHLETGVQTRDLRIAQSEGTGLFIALVFGGAPPQVTEINRS